MGDILTPGQWNDLRIQLKKKYPYLTDSDMPYYEAEEEDMLCMIKFKLQEYRENNLLNQILKPDRSLEYLHKSKSSLKKNILT